MKGLGFAAIFAAAATAAWWVLSSDPELRALESPFCGLEPGSTIAYRVSLEREAWVDLAPVLQALEKASANALDLSSSPPAHESEHQEWLLQLEVISEESPESRVLAASLDRVDAEPTGSVFLIRVGQDCEITDFARQPGQTKDSARAQQNLVTQLQFARREGSFQTFDGYGVFELISRVEQHEGATIVRGTRARYDKGFLGLTGIPPKVVEGSITVWPGRGPWFDVLESHTKLTLEANSAAAGRVEAHCVARRAKGQGVTAPFPPSDVRWIWGHVLGAPTRAPPRPRPEQVAAFKGKVFQDVLAFYLGLAGEAGSVVQRLEYLRSFFAADPENILAAYEYLRNPKALTDVFGGRSELILAIGLADTPEARAALLRMMSDPEFVLHDQHRAAWALIRSEDVPAELTERVFRRAREGTTRYDRSVMSLISGALSNETLVRDGAAQLEALGAIQEWLTKQSDTEQLLDTLAAVGNSGSEGFHAKSAPYLDSELEDVRVSAADALRRMPFERVRADFERRYVIEQSSTVRHHLLWSAIDSASGTPSASLDGLVGPALRRINEAGLGRGELIETWKFLGEASLRGNSTAGEAIRNELRGEIAASSPDLPKIEILSRYAGPKWRRD
ncbi:MAG: hypothetical protein HY791_35565 [Deltaproteobacteria bacterium]|nr:hypothetical protein [Deltaproteobacteria bacterium]